MSSNTNTNTSFDNLLLQSLMGRLQLRSPYLNTNSHLSQNLEDFLLDTNSFGDDNDEDDDDDNCERSILAKEEAKLEKEIIRTILSGNIETLKANSGQAVAIGEHHICVGFHQEKESDYRVWEWHGHIMLFDDVNGYTPEYIYGNYFERLLVKPTPPDDDDDDEADKEEEKEEDIGNLGLRELIDDAGSCVSGRILRRNMNAGSTRF